MIENEENLLLGQISPSGDIVGSLMAEKGAKGDPGEPGEPGQDGQAATIQVGTVTTGEPGTQAIVENVGTESEAIFNFTIPRGADGSGSGTGDMLKSVYDANNNNIVDNAEKVNNHTVESDVPSDAVFTDTTYTAGTGIDITNGVISNTQTSAEWGNITGTLSNQTDLQNALDSKANSTHTHSGNDITTGTTYYGTVSSGGASYSTVVFDSTINIVKGDVLFIKWNIAQTGGNLKMNTNGNPSIPLMYKGSQITDNVISVGDVSEVVYDGTYFQLLSINKWIGNVNQKQDTLVSGTNIKTINGESILGGTDINTCKSFKLTFVDEINHIAYYKCNVGKQLIEGDSFLIKIGNVYYGDSSSAVISFDDGQNYYGIRDTELENIELSSLSNSIINFIYRTSIDYGIYFEINAENISKNEVAISSTEPTGSEEIWIDPTEPLSNVGTEVVNSLNGNEVNKAPSVNVIKSLLNTIFPIGKVEIFFDNNDHSNYMGFTWERTSAGKVPVNIDTSQTEFNTIGKTGGEKTHTLTKNEMPKHFHNVTLNQQTTGEVGLAFDWTYNSERVQGYSGSSFMNEAGGDQPHNNLPPYEVMAFWKRVS